jgi:hypothetical protein
MRTSGLILATVMVLVTAACDHSLPEGPHQPPQIQPSGMAAGARPSDLFVITAKPLVKQPVAPCVNRRGVAQSIVATSAPAILSVTLHRGEKRSVAEQIARCLRSLRGPRLAVTITHESATPG